MQRHFNTHIEGIDLGFWHALIESRGRLVTFKRGDVLCRKGEPTHEIGYVKSGYLIYSIGDRIGGFTFPEALFGDYPGCMYGAPANFDIVAGSSGEVWMMDASILPELFNSDARIARQGLRFSEAAYTSLVRRYCASYSETPAERYTALLAEHPQIQQDVPQKEIARYLGITPVALSRIKKRLLKPKE